MCFLHLGSALSWPLNLLSVFFWDKVLSIRGIVVGILLAVRWGFHRMLLSMSLVFFILVLLLMLLKRLSLSHSLDGTKRLSVENPKVAQFPAPNSKNCSHNILNYWPTHLIKLPSESIRSWSFVWGERTYCFPNFFLRERALKLRQVKTWHIKLFQIYCYLSVRAFPQKRIIETENIIFLFLVLGEQKAIICQELMLWKICYWCDG